MINEHETTTLVPGADIADELIGLAARAQQQLVLVRAGKEGIGSGVVWRTDGLIVTNHHVVARQRQVTVVFADNRELEAKVVASDPTLDLGVLQVKAADLPATPFGSSGQLRLGELVMAVGNPWGQRGVVTLGVVSGLGELTVPWRGAPAAYIRSDVLLAPGNSGGPLLNMRGEVVGINAMILGGDLSVAIPSDIVSQFLALAIERRPVPQPSDVGVLL